MADLPELIKQVSELTNKVDALAKKVSYTPPETMVFYVLILALVIALPTIIDIFYAYYSRNKSWKLLLQEAGKDKLEKDELQELIKAAAAGPPGISGMSRSLMAFAVIVVLGIAVFHLLGNCQSGKYDEIIKNVLSMLAATLASITGFYFGGKSVEQKAPAPQPARGKDQEKEEARRKAEEEAKRKAAEEEARKKADEEAKKKAEEEANQ